MKHAHAKAQILKRPVRAIAFATALAGMAALLLAGTAHAQSTDVYGGPGSDTQTIHHCGWVPTQRIDFAKQNSRNVVIIQRKLAEMGYYRAAIDGVNGPLTKSAIRKFQSENGHQLVDGIVGIETSAGLGMNANPAGWVRGCRRPYNGESVLRYYPRW